MGFDAAGNLYVTRWRLDASPATTGNATEVFDLHGQSLGSFGTGYDCDPHAIVFAPSGTAYIGQAGCTGAVLKIAPGQMPIPLDVAPDHQGSFWVDLASDACTLFYTSWGPNVKRFNVCTGVQRPNFNVAPLPGGEAHDLRVLPDGGVLVSSGDVIARLNAAGALVQTYSAAGEWAPWTGLDLVGDGTFWAGNYESSNVYRFELTTGAVVAAFNTGTPAHTVVGIRVEEIAAGSFWALPRGSRLAVRTHVARQGEPCPGEFRSASNDCQPRRDLAGGQPGIDGDGRRGSAVAAGQPGGHRDIA